jgi:hypothetical protein
MGVEIGLILRNNLPARIFKRPNPVKGKNAGNVPRPRALAPAAISLKMGRGSRHESAQNFFMRSEITFAPATAACAHCVEHPMVVGPLGA